MEARRGGAWVDLRGTAKGQWKMRQVSASSVCMHCRHRLVPVEPAVGDRYVVDTNRAHTVYFEMESAGCKMRRSTSPASRPIGDRALPTVSTKTQYQISRSRPRWWCRRAGHRGQRREMQWDGPRHYHLKNCAARFPSMHRQERLEESARIRCHNSHNSRFLRLPWCHRAPRRG